MQCKRCRWGHKHPEGKGNWGWEQAEGEAGTRPKPWDVGGCGRSVQVSSDDMQRQKLSGARTPVPAEPGEPKEGAQAYAGRRLSRPSVRPGDVTPGGPGEPKEGAQAYARRRLGRPGVRPGNVTPGGPEEPGDPKSRMRAPRRTPGDASVAQAYARATSKLPGARTPAPAEPGEPKAGACLSRGPEALGGPPSNSPACSPRRERRRVFRALFPACDVSPRIVRPSRPGLRPGDNGDRSLRVGARSALDGAGPRPPGRGPDTLPPLG